MITIRPVLDLMLRIQRWPVLSHSDGLVNEARTASRSGSSPILFVTSSELIVSVGR